MHMYDVCCNKSYLHKFSDISTWAKKLFLFTMQVRQKEFGDVSFSLQIILSHAIVVINAVFFQSFV